MQVIFNFKLYQSFFLIEQIDVVIMLAVTVFFFLIILGLGVRKSYKLKKENERLNAMSEKFEDEEDKPYKDFTEGHMYDNK